MTKQPPTSLRIPLATRQAVEAWATERGIPRNAAYVELIERGLKLAKTPPTPAKPAGVPRSREAKAPKDTAPKLDLPVFGSFERKPMQKAPKRKG